MGTSTRQAKKVKTEPKSKLSSTGTKSKEATPKFSKPSIDISNYFKPTKCVRPADAKALIERVKAKLNEKHNSVIKKTELAVASEVVIPITLPKESTFNATLEVPIKDKVFFENNLTVPILGGSESALEKSFNLVDFSDLQKATSNTVISTFGEVRDEIPITKQLLPKAPIITGIVPDKLSHFPNKYVVIYQHLSNLLRQMFMENGNVNHFKWTEIQRYSEEANNRNFEFHHLKQILFVLPNLLLMSPVMEGRQIDYKIQLNMPFLQEVYSTRKQSDVEEAMNLLHPFQFFRKRQAIIQIVLDRFQEALDANCLQAFNQFLAERQLKAVTKIPLVYHELYEVDMMTPELQQAILEAETKIKNYKPIDVLQTLRQSRDSTNPSAPNLNRYDDPTARAKAALAKARKLLKEPGGIDQLFSNSTPDATLVERQAAIHRKSKSLLERVQKNQVTTELIKKEADNQPISNQLQYSLKLLPKFVLGLATHFFTVKDNTRGIDLHSFLASLRLDESDSYSIPQKMELAELAAQVLPKSVFLIQDRFLGKLIAVNLRDLNKKFVDNSIHNFKQELTEKNRLRIQSETKVDEF